ncbi:alpha/beta hydrolase [Lentibacillus salicampi]|uniref:Alpha/beta hydrolase n=1 Tax=Lentibacillus salicampi TaxID=175306 RepID=A0A4Y9A985_9BACI|nr:alpha/beta hydrolase [Lentibacillus salicampi]TFJ91440.1 alpha/beta hydrolase [Lentibacillus salicampi]
MKRKQVISTILMCTLAIGVISWFYAPEKTRSEGHIRNATVFVHGYKGTENSFGNMLSRFEHTYGWGQTSLMYRVSAAGKLDLNVYRRNSGDITEPLFVQAVFENNRAGFQDTSAGLAKLLAHMKETFQINKVNLVGHSMGGLVSMDFIESYENGKVYPAVDKLITIGSPFDGIYNDGYFHIHHDAGAEDLKPDSYALKRLQLNKDVIPDQLDVLSIGSTGDPVAVPESVGTIQDIVDPAQLTYKMIDDDTLGHSALHEDARVDKMIYSFLNPMNKIGRTTKD